MRISNILYQRSKKINKNQVNIKNVNSVASFFISRIDTEVDKIIDNEHKGKIAIYNAIKAYEDYEKIFSDKDFKDLEKLGANTQKLLWASTSVKNPDYEKLLYVENLLAPETVNTVPEDVYNEIINNVNDYKSFLNEEIVDLISESSISEKDFESITDNLLSVGIRLFEEAFDSLIAELEKKLP